MHSLALQAQFSASGYAMGVAGKFLTIEFLHHF